MRDPAILVGILLIALGIAAAPGWLGIVGAGRWRRGTAGGRLAVAAAALLTPFAVCLLCGATVSVWMAFSQTAIMPWWIDVLQEALDDAVPYATALFPLGLALVALAARAALVAASRRLAENAEPGSPP
ncbi:hypothetical protein [Alienimonas sp. DA493]|uniref:hypothetical protein n=1 Tax=Alienimonas sp. DA493 TaxID=3373605 RepID=UPI003754EDE2